MKKSESNTGKALSTNTTTMTMTDLNDTAISVFVRHPAIATMKRLAQYLGLSYRQAVVESVRLWTSLFDLDEDELTVTKHGPPLTLTRADRDRIRLLDGNQCVVCGWTREQNGKQLAVHHLNEDMFDNRDENLVSLCKRCHWRIHGGRQVFENRYPELYKRWVTIRAEGARRQPRMSV